MVLIRTWLIMLFRLIVLIVRRRILRPVLLLLPWRRLLRLRLLLCLLVLRRTGPMRFLVDGV